MDDQLTGHTIEGFTIGLPIASGGMGRIYQAHHPDHPRPFAIKVLLPEFAQDASFRTRFWREAELMMQLRHPHIVPVLTYGEWQGYLYIIMKLVRGPSLERILHYRSFTPLTAWQIIRPVSAALGFGHQHHVLHRDLKTANILIEPRGGGNHVYLADFGLGKRPGLDQTLTASGISVGTPEYMAPEVAMGRAADHRADLYSIGVIAYELLLGRLPFEAKSPQMIALAHVDQPVPRPRVMVPHFPRQMEGVLLHALAKDPDARYQTAADFQQAYRSAVQAMTETARRTCYWLKPPT